MVEKFYKFIEKSPQKDRYLAVIRAIRNGDLSGYDDKPLTGKSGYRRVRVGSVRFVYRQTTTGNMIVRVGNRGDIYKGL